MKTIRIRMAVALVISAGAATTVFSQSPAGQTLTALAQLEPGEWRLKSKDSGQIRSICIGDVKQVLQVRHPSASCSRFVIANDPTMTTVHYTCPGQGHGRTTVRVETPRLAQIESQGIMNNSPFDDSYEARRMGPCAGPAGGNSGR